MADSSKIFRFASEAAMCAAFVAEADKRKWQAYPETGGFDLVMVHKRTGLQVGIEAKQSLNAEVAMQAVNHMRTGSDQGPDFHAVLVPQGGQAAMTGVLDLVGITTIRADGPNRFWPNLPGEHELQQDRQYFWESSTWHQLCPSRQIKLPDYIPDSKAGSPSPVTLTDWKVRAIKLAVLADRRGFITLADFEALKLSRSRWVQNGWITPIRRGVWRAGRMPDFKAQHPVNFEQIATDFDKWAPPVPAIASDLLEACNGG